MPIVACIDGHDILCQTSTIPPEQMTVVVSHCKSRALLYPVSCGGVVRARS